MSLLPGGDRLHIASGIREFALASPGAVAVVDGDRSLTFRDVDRRASQVAQALLSRGLGRGDFVGVALGNRLEYPEVAAGIAKAGMVSVPLNPRYTSREATHVLTAGHVAAVIGDDALAHLYGDHAGQLFDTVFGITDGGTDPQVGEPYERVLDDARPEDPRAPVGDTDPYSCTFTGGTTGLPKGVLLSHRSRSLIFLGGALEWGLGPGRRTIAVAPMYHGAGFAFAYMGPATGGSVAMLRSWDPEQFLALLGTYRPHSVFLVPAHLQMLRAMGESTLADANTEGLEVIYCNAAPLPQPLKLWAMDSLPDVGFHEVYGATETGVVTNCRPVDMRRKERCVGPAWFLNTIKLIDPDTGQPAEPGQPGELFTRSPMVFNGYLDNPEATAAAVDDDGFVTVGDIAVKDEDGFYYIIDRVKDMIISGGTNVYPREVEEVVITHPGVAECAVIGVEDETWGESVTAVVVRRDPGASGEVATAEALDAHVRGHLAGYKVPKRYDFVDALPKSAAGKVLKREIRVTT
ncbi:class I adenylate-forming enzyme family protein [Euzebya tangerina]|uniref:class I adenylate-forming enzyme family protein n=1 Tax=Euzebya tangerina TaxID=591198 RepID=UPI000E315388|nr:class I adenylate-forming enzyme family protein [Euzebya tangerina]